METSLHSNVSQMTQLMTQGDVPSMSLTKNIDCQEKITAELDNNRLQVHKVPPPREKVTQIIV